MCTKRRKNRSGYMPDLKSNNNVEHKSCNTNTTQYFNLPYNPLPHLYTLTPPYFTSQYYPCTIQNRTLQYQYHTLPLITITIQYPRSTQHNHTCTEPDKTMPHHNDTSLYFTETITCKIIYKTFFQ